MQITRLQNENSVAALVTRIYGLKPTDPRSAQAAKVLVAANPQLAGQIANLPAGTPVIVPQISGISATSSAIGDPTSATWMSLLDTLVDSASQASNAVQTGVATTAPKKRTAQLTKGLALLKSDVAQFKKIH